MKVCPLPGNGFYDNDTKLKIQEWKYVNMLRWAHCKSDHYLDELEANLNQYIDKHSKKSITFRIALKK